MDTRQITKEIKSPALKEIVESLVTIIDRVRSGEISHQKASSEITGHKHIIQSLALDWAFNRKGEGLARLRKIAHGQS
jgi:hypothetical protein